MATPVIREATTVDIEAIKQIAVDTNMFASDEVDAFDEMLGGFVDGSPDGHAWVVGELDGRVVGAAYYAPEPFGDRVWNLHFLAADPSTQGAGVGSALLRDAEAAIRALGPEAARVMIIETSSTDQYARTRDFYIHHDFVEEARIREFYGPGDHKVVFWKSLAA